METVRLYRQLNKAARNWPLDTGRKNRDLGAHLRRRLAYAFRNAKVGSEAERQQLLQGARRELEAIRKLTSNFYKQEVRLLQSMSSEFNIYIREGCS